MQKSIIEELKSTGDYSITVEVIIEDHRTMGVFVPKCCPDHFVDLIFFELTTFLGAELKKGLESRWEIIGWQEDEGRWRSGKYTYSARDIRDYGIHLAGEFALLDIFGERCFDIGSVEPLSVNLTPSEYEIDNMPVPGKCGNSECGFGSRCRNYHKNGEVLHELVFVPPDELKCYHLDYIGFHPDVVDDTNGQERRYFALNSSSRWVGAFPSKEVALSIVGPALQHDIGGYSGLSLHTFDEIPANCRLYHDIEEWIVG